MIEVENIKPLTDFLRNSKSHISNLQESGSPEVLTVNGEAAVIVQDANAYQELASLAQQAKEDARLKKALEALRNGEMGVPSDASRKTILNELSQ